MKYVFSEFSDIGKKMFTPFLKTKLLQSRLMNIWMELFWFSVTFTGYFGSKYRNYEKFIVFAEKYLFKKN
jgi:hypothetical protein